MPTEKKIRAVKELGDTLSRCSIVLSTGYQGLNVSQMTDLRRRLREKELEFKVVKNTLVEKATQQTNKEGLKQIIQGPTGLVLGYGDQVEAARALTEYIRTSRINLALRGALLDGQLLTAEQVSELVNLPPRNVLAARVVGQLASPFYSVVYLLQANLTSLVTVLQRHSEQLAANKAS